MKRYQAFYLKSLSNFRKTHLCAVEFLGRKLKRSFPNWGFVSILLAENEFSGLYGEGL